MASVIVVTTDKRYHVLPASLSHFWRVLAREEEVIQLQLSSEDYEKWFMLATLIKSDAVSHQEYFLHDRVILYRHDYERMMRAMQGGRLRWLLYCMPDDSDSVEEYETLGRVVIDYYPVVPSIANHSRVVSTGDSKLTYSHAYYMGVLYRDLMLKGGVINSSGRLDLRPDQISSHKLIQHNLAVVMTD